MGRFPHPRLLPLTIFGLALLLAVKSTVLVRAVVGAGQAVGQSMLPSAQAASHDAASKGAATHGAAKQGAAAHGAAKENPAADAGKGSPTAAPTQPAEAKPPQDPPISDSERAVLLELRQRREQLESREAGLVTREAMLTATERKLTGRVDELQALQKKLEALEASRVQREDSGWQGLVKLYETMKPRDAATILNELDMQVLLQVIDRMKEGKAAPILAAMHPDRAREVTDRLARLRVRDPAAARDRG